MEANELRIGNFINRHFEGGSGVLEECNIRDIFDVLRAKNEKDFKFSFTPVLLTEEWLTRFGFERGGYDSLFVIKGNFELAGDCPADYPDQDVPPMGITYNNKLTVEVKYVHQLQNLYFALTGTELTLNS